MNNRGPVYEKPEAQAKSADTSRIEEATILSQLNSHNKETGPEISTPDRSKDLRQRALESMMATQTPDNSSTFHPLVSESMLPSATSTPT